MHMYDLAISAVSYDALLVNDVLSRVSPRLGRPAVWARSAPPVGELAAPLVHEDVSRVVLVLGQRLWGHDDITARDAVSLQPRACRLPRSVVVVSLDDDPLPAWMTPLVPRDLASAGIEGIVQSVLDAVANAGGRVQRERIARAAAVAEPAPRWSAPPTPLLGQPRADGMLRRELDALCTELQPQLDAVNTGGGDPVMLEVQRTPNRVVARLEDVSVSFSWVPGRGSTVAAGRLMVIEWRGVVAARGAGVLEPARPVRERVYSAEADGAGEWRWRADAPNGRASSTANLAGEWIAGALLTARADATGGLA